VTGAIAAAGTVGAAALRVAAVLPNVTAVGALGLFAGGRLPRWLAWAPPLAVMAVTDVALHRLYGYPMFNRWVYAAVLGYVLLGRLLAGTTAPGRIGAVTLLGSVQFFLLTNFGVWWNSHGLAHALYPPTAGGLLACYVAALPFFGYTVLGDLGFTAVLFGAHALLTRPATEPAPAAEEVRA
jgi:hypothetical protein